MGKRKKGTLIATDSKGAFACVKDQGMHVLQLRPTGQGLGEVLHKIFKRIYEKVVIDETAIERLRMLENKTKGPLKH